MTTRTCSLDYCEAPHSAHGYCQAHYQQEKRGQPLRPLKVIPTVCSLDFCDRPHSGLGLCEAHREQQRRGKPFTPIQTKRVQAEHCLKCDLPPKARDLCPKHYNEMTRRAKGMLPKAERDTLNRQSRVTSDKAKRNDKPKVVKPKVTSGRNPNLPKGWESRREVKVRKQTSPADNLILDLGTLTPLAPWIPARMRVILDRRGALDLVDVLGLDEMADAS